MIGLMRRYWYIAPLLPLGWLVLRALVWLFGPWTRSF